MSIGQKNVHSIPSTGRRDLLGGQTVCNLAIPVWEPLFLTDSEREERANGKIRGRGGMQYSHKIFLSISPARVCEIAIGLRQITKRNSAPRRESSDGGWSSLG